MTLALVQREDETDIKAGKDARRNFNTQAPRDELLEKNKADLLSEAERLELTKLRAEADRFMLGKAQAAVLLRWRGHAAPIL